MREKSISPAKLTVIAEKIQSESPFERLLLRALGKAREWEEKYHYQFLAYNHLQRFFPPNLADRVHTFQWNHPGPPEILAKGLEKVYTTARRVRVTTCLGLPLWAPDERVADYRNKLQLDLIRMGSPQDN